MTGSWSSTHDRLLIVGGTGLLDGFRVGVAASRAPGGGIPALLRAREVAPVRVMPLGELPEGMVAVGEALADRLRLTETGSQPWQLTPTPATPAAVATIEPIADSTLKKVIEELARATDVAGRVVHLEPGDASSWLDVDGSAMRIREATDARGEALSGLVEITEQTELMLFGSRAGVDIVVLADCSGSMVADDIVTRTNLIGRRAGTPIKRSEVQRVSLLELLEARKRVAGRVSRIALVKFTHQSTSVFPRGGGMAEMDAGSDPAVFDEFEEAINQLVPRERSGTDIGQALHFASELLYRYGVPGNDRLIVLVSDGAHLTSKGEDKTGEVVNGTDEPVLLMEELHRTSGIRLHAIGISDRDLFETWWKQRYGNRPQEASIVPNHELLRELIEVGGGERAQIGGMEVLEKYFSGLGTGASRGVGRPAKPRLPALQPELGEALRRVGQVDPQTRHSIEQLADRIRGVYSLCVAASRRRDVGRLFQPSERQLYDLADLGRLVSRRLDFVGWISSVYKVFSENLDERLRPGSAEPYPIREIVALLGPDSEFDRLFALRHDEVHDRPGQQAHTWAGKFYAKCTRRYALDPEDAANWARVQLGALEVLLGALVRVEQVINRAEPDDPDDEPENEDEPVVLWPVS
ncbi:vWA domain-containing protein [Paractinoplanes lichenicola]|uniref:VWA domain-containing protein n=1 Tax=Paractinoplanes lichenicola TaxID=2802976 RepID=A0ABS1VU92_9ACTN|nr:vWA domain-containing protein [Actinoplanes lichenicola]MBL7258012.1 VWA domain-containing protein [Actinoplanes lichenicola]